MISHPSRAFTLIELLVVVSVIAVLAGISLPVISNVKESGNSTKCISNLRQIGSALSLYCADNNNYFPPITVAAAGGNQDWTSYAITPYLPDRSTGASIQANTIFICPSAKYTGYANSVLSRTYTVTDCMAGPSSSDPTSNYSSKVANTRTALNSATGNLLLFDGCQSGVARYSAVNASWSNVSGAPDLQATATTSTYIDYRHRKAFNGLYADGHVDTIKRADASRLITVQTWRMSNQY